MATSAPANYLGGFNANPTAQLGNGAYGAVPGAVAIPPSIYSQVNQAVPGAAGLAAGSAANIASEEAGTLSPGTLQQLQNASAAFGVNAGTPFGQPGNTLPTENLLTNMGLTSEQLSQQGNQNYLNFLGGVGATQIDPSLAASIAQSNAQLAAAPNPAAAAQQQQNLMMQWYNLTNPKPPPVNNNNPASAVATGGTGTWLTNAQGTVPASLGGYYG
jgi:hypothetical protein